MHRIRYIAIAIFSFLSTLFIPHWQRFVSFLMCLVFSTSSTFCNVSWLASSDLSDDAASAYNASDSAIASLNKSISSSGTLESQIGNQSLIADSGYCKTGTVISLGMAPGFDGKMYFISYDFSRGVEKLNPLACGREYQSQPDPNLPYHGLKLVYLVDGFRNRVGSDLYVELADGSLQVFKPSSDSVVNNSQSNSSDRKNTSAVDSLDDGNGFSAKDTANSSSSSSASKKTSSTATNQGKKDSTTVNNASASSSSSSSASNEQAIQPKLASVIAPSTNDAVTSVDVKINFQPTSSAVPSGYTKDSGLAYDSARGFGWVRQDSLDNSTHVPLDISPNTRDRNRTGVEPRLDTIIHMQYPTSATSTTAVKTPAAWEYNVPNGMYSVTVSVGDQSPYDSTNVINVEGVRAIRPFTGNSGTFPQEYELNTVQVNVSDGRLTVDAIGGTNTKLNYVEIQGVSSSVNHPSVTGGSPVSREQDVSRTAAVTLDVNLPNAKGVDPNTLNSSTVRLYRTRDNAAVVGTVNTSGGGDSIVFQPASPLDASTNYTFRVSNGVKDESGADFLPFATTFVTGTRSISPTPGVSWNKTVVYSGSPISTLMISPNQGKLYAAGLDGTIRRWNIDSQGNLTNMQVFQDTNNKFTGRAIIGLAFNPKITTDGTLWVANNDPLPFNGEKSNDFSGKVSRITLQNTSTSFAGSVADFVVGLPRSVRDHMSNSLAYGPDNKLYLNQGSNSGMGAPDSAWGYRPERLLNAAVLRIDQGATLPPGGFNVQTEDYVLESGPNVGQLTKGSYNPYASGAPVTIFASGPRNAYDLVWHSNGKLYLPTNGSAAGSNTPDNPNTSTDEGLSNVGTQNDYLFKVPSTGGGYYGHPNPKRNQYIMNGGNPTSGVDPAEVVAQGTHPGYPVGTQPDPNYKFFAYNFGRNRSPDGALEYKSSTFNGTLKNQILVTEYSAGDDILALPLDSNGNVIASKVTQAASGFIDPVDIAEDTKNTGNIGTIYVAELINGGMSGQITRLRPAS